MVPAPSRNQRELGEDGGHLFGVASTRAEQDVLPSVHGAAARAARVATGAAGSSGGTTGGAASYVRREGGQLFLECRSVAGRALWLAIPEDDRLELVVAALAAIFEDRHTDEYIGGSG